MAVPHIKKIELKKLFNALDWTVKSNDSPITFAISPNGMGKTKLLHLIHYVLEPTERNYKLFGETVPYEEILITFEDASYIRKKHGHILESTVNAPVNVIHTYESQDFTAMLKNEFITEDDMCYLSDVLKKISECGPQELFVEKGKIRAKSRYDGSALPISVISDGIKQFLGLLVTVIHAPDGSIVLMDTPETHMHIEFQSYFTEQLLSISESKRLQVFVATHSPSIIGTNFGCISAEVR